MSEICDEPVKIIGYEDDWMILTSQKYVKTSENRIKKAMHQITKWVDNTGFEISIEKTKLETVNKPTINIWIKGERIEQVRQHRILGLIFDSRMTWNEQILDARAKAENKNESH
jgi:hypothetical protein